MPAAGLASGYGRGLAKAGFHDIMMTSAPVLCEAQYIPIPSVLSRSPRGCAELLQEFEQRIGVSSPRLLHFEEVNDRDVYNITAPFELGGQLLLAGRVERRDCELAETIIFRHDAQREAWAPYFASRLFQNLQDPCVAFVDGELILGGVEYPHRLPNGRLTWIMRFFRGRSLSTLRPFLSGPLRMKDIRICQMHDGQVAVFSRPQGTQGGRGKIGLAIVPSLEHITAQLINDAPILERQFADGEWGGANEVHLLEDGRLGVLGHVARWDNARNRHYYPIVFAVDPRNKQCTPLQIIARRSLFPHAPAKRSDLNDVVFSGGLIRHADGTATLYAGLSDAAAGSLIIPDPLLALSQEHQPTIRAA